LKQSVQNAVYEQKDPLLIYKMEAFGLFKNFITHLNEETTQFLLKNKVMAQDSNEVQSSRPAQRPQKQVYHESKEEVHSALEGPRREEGHDAQRPKQQPIVSQRIANRNDKVTVQYLDGTLKKDVKFKQVEEDLKNNRCVLLEA
jgi:preprotein translocase subunit SecA